VPRDGIKLRRVHRHFRPECPDSQLCVSTLATFTAPVAATFTAPVAATFTAPIAAKGVTFTAPVSTYAAIAHAWGFGG